MTVLSSSDVPKLFLEAMKNLCCLKVILGNSAYAPVTFDGWIGLGRGYGTALFH